MGITIQEVIRVRGVRRGMRKNNVIISRIAFPWAWWVVGEVADAHIPSAPDVTRSAAE